MGKILPLVIFLFTSQICFTQSNWQLQYPLPSDNSHIQVEFLDNSTLMTISYDGEIYKSIDKGISWNLIYNNKDIDFQKFTFFDQNTGYVTCYDEILKTTNGGNSFEVLPKAGYELQFISGDTGFCISDTSLYKTIDGAISWNRISTFEATRISKVHFINNSIGLIITQTDPYVYRLYKTIDGGKKWNEVILGNNLSYINDIYFIDSNTGYLNGHDFFYLTTNSGTSWVKRQTVINGIVRPCEKVRFKNTFEGIALFPASNYKYHLGKTIDGGITWSISDSLYSQTLNGIATNNNDAIYCGNSGVFIRSTNFGSTWKNNHQFFGKINKIDFINELTGYIVTGQFDENFNSLFKTENGGINWLPAEDFIYNKGINDFFILSENERYLLIKDSVFKTTNNGLSWIKSIIPNATSLTNFNTITMIGDTGYVQGGSSAPGTGGYPLLYKTTDRAETWIEVEAAHSNLQIINSKTIYSLKSNHSNQTYSILKTTNGASNWSMTVLPFNQQVNSLFIHSDSSSFLNVNGKIYKSDNDSTNWNMVFEDSYVGSGLFFFINSEIGFITSSDHIIYTTNKGNNWINYSDNSIKPFYLADFVNDSLGYVVSVNGGIYKTINRGGTVGINMVTNSQTPASFSLSQNYPNPFNPSTNISFEIPHKERVSLKVYNILGQSVAELVNQDLSAGSYSYSFNASNLPSGVYFYKLTAGNEFIQTKKMLLIK